MTLAFAEADNLLVVITKNNSITYWDVTHNVPRDDPIDWTREFGGDDPELYFKRPTGAALSIKQNLLAVVYRGEDILLWSLGEDRVYDMYTKESGSRRFERLKVADGSTTVWALAFCTTAEANLLIATYSDGDLVVFDTDSGTPRGSIDGINSQAIACSPDGRALATANSHGIIHLFDLKTLRLIHQLRFDTEDIRTKMLAFTSDSLRLLDIRGHQLRVWDPTVLLQYDFEDAHHSPLSYPSSSRGTGHDPVENAEIASIICLWSTPVVFCGKEDGSLYVYDITEEPRGRQLFTQTYSCAITFLHFDEQSSILTCGDLAGRVTCRRVTRESNMDWISDDPIIDLRNGVAVLQAITSEKHGRILISTTQHDTLWAFAPENREDYMVRIDGNTKTRWSESPLDDELLVQLGPNTASFFRWKSLERVRSVSLTSAQGHPLSIDSVIVLHHPRYFVTARRERPDDRGSPTNYHLWDFGDFKDLSMLEDAPQSEPVDAIMPALDCGALGLKVEKIVGVAKGRIVFLSPDNWICSAKFGLEGKGLRTTAEESTQFTEAAIRHFFIPDEWASLLNRILIGVRRSGEIVFAKRTELAVIRHGLDITEKGAFNSHRTGSI